MFKIIVVQNTKSLEREMAVYKFWAPYMMNPQTFKSQQQP